MDFFQHQSKAKSRTTLLILLYSLGLLGLTGAIVIAALLFCVAVDAPPDPASMLLCVFGILALVIGGSLFKTAQLSAGGGKVVAESLGGRQVHAATTNPADRQLYNVVEEMSLAAGVPMPALYIMDNEKSINAFAAGFSPNAAVIGVNRGTVDLLSRDELQGVIAHEFAHILNGDMRLSMRIIGILFGLQLIALLGYFAFRAVPYIAAGRQNKGTAGAIVALLGIGITLMIIGYIGVFFSAIIKAAISRQREYLADASAVQFTRNPDGIVGAFKKIGAVGSGLKHANAAEASHLFFGNTCGLFSLGGLLATHPDLTTRIRRIDPRFDGRFPKMSDIRPLKPSDFSHDFSRRVKAQNSRPTLASKESVIEHISELTVANVLTAAAMLREIPKPVAVSADNPLTAQAVLFAMLLDLDETIRNRQLTQIKTNCVPFLFEETQRLYPHICTLPEHEKIPLAQHVSTTFREMTKQQYIQFSKVLNLLIAADQKMDIFEYTIKAVLHRDLDIYFGLAKQLRVKFTAMPQVRMQVRAVLSYLAYAGHTAMEEASGAFSAAMKELGLPEEILRPFETTNTQFECSLRTLAETSPALKKQIFSAFMTCVWYDGKITPKEAGLIRAIAAILAIPIPVLA